MKKISEEYLNLQTKLHDNPNYGTASISMAPLVKKLFDDFEFKSISDYGAGKKNLEITLRSGRIFGSEGLAINISVYVENVETEFLPLNCNWIASNLLPKFDEKKNTFVEPYLPNYKIGIMHLAAGIWKDNKDMRLDKKVKIDIKTLENTTITKSLRFGQ